MTEKKARRILLGAIQGDNSLFSLGWYLYWDGKNIATLDGVFKPIELEAIAWWMQHKRITDYPT